MKTAYTPDNKSWTEFLSAFNTELEDKLRLPLEVVHKINGPATLTYINAGDIDLYVTLQFTDKPRSYSLTWLLDHAHLTFVDDVTEVLTEILEAFKAAQNERQSVLIEEKRRAQELQAQKQEEAKKAELEAKKREKIAKQIRSMRPETLSSDYELIGWLARNIGSISATVPSDLDDWFVKNFGNVEHSVVASDAKTCNGNPMKYSVSFHASFKSELPTLLLDKPGVKKKSIDSVSYIWSLIADYGFRFGKTQDLEAIRKCIPVTYISEFEKGLGPDPQPKTKQTRKTKAVA